MGSPLDGFSPKYKITKHDGSSVDPKARYLTLRVDNKPPESPEGVALVAYLSALADAGDRALVAHLCVFFGHVVVVRSAENGAAFCACGSVVR